LLLATHLIGLNAWAWQERHSLADKQAGVRALLTQTFPQVKVVVDAPVQMERELALLRQATGSLSPRDLEPLLAASAQALSAHLPGASAQAIDFSPGQLRLRGLSPSPEALQALQEQLSTAGYLASMDNDTLVVQARNGL
jgi:general secretion pathway protein L